MWPLTALVALTAALALTVWSAREGSPRAKSRVSLDVFAAASLTDAFAEIAGMLEQRADVDVRLTFAGSQTLRLQLEQGADTDLYASADHLHVLALQRSGVVGEAVHFASNQLSLVVPANGDHQLSSFAGLGGATRLVVGSERVPVGSYTARLFANGAAVYGEDWRAAVAAAVVSRELNVRLLRTKVELGEADAGVVYRSDALGREGLRMVPIPPPLNVAVGYYIATVGRERQRPAARLWLELLSSAAGRQVLQRWGFATGDEPLPELP